MQILGFGAIGPWQLGIILAVILLIFGHRIPGLARALGTGIVEFKKGLKSGERDGELPPSSRQETVAREKREQGA